MKKLSTFIFIISTAFILQGCVHKVVTVPVKVAYKTTKGVVKGTAAIAKKAMPNKDKKEDKDKD